MIACWRLHCTNVLGGCLGVPGGEGRAVGAVSRGARLGQNMCKYPPRARLGTVVTQLQFFRAGGPCECPHPYQRAAIRTEQATL